MKSISISAFTRIIIGCAAFLFQIAPAIAATYSYSGVVTWCAGTCIRFASFDVGTQISGTYEINTTPDGSFAFADISPSFGVDVFDPASPVEPFDGSDVLSANPLPLDHAIAPLAEMDAFGNTTGGMTDASNELVSGTLLHEFVVAPFSDNFAWLIFDLASGGGQICLFYTVFPCTPNGTEWAVIEGGWTLQSAAVPPPAAVWLFGSALLGLAGARRRKSAPRDLKIVQRAALSKCMLV